MASQISAEEALRLFNLKENYTDKDLKARYRELTKKWHPDINPNPNAEEIMQKINIAYEVLQEARGTFTSSVITLYKHSSFFDIVKTTEVVERKITKIYKHVTFFDVAKEA